MEKAKRSYFSARTVSYLAVLTALVIVLQVFGGYFKIGATSLSFVLVPIVLGGMLLGPVAGGFLGGIFGCVVIFDALGGLDPFTMFLLQEQPVFTVLLCLVKGIAAGVVPALAYKFVVKKNKYVAVFLAGALAPLCNTGIFVLGAFLIMEPINAFLVAAGMDLSGFSAAYIVFVVCVGVNFFVEFAISLLLSPALYSVTNVVEKQFSKKKKSGNRQIENKQEDEANDNLS